MRIRLVVAVVMILISALACGSSAAATPTLVSIDLSGSYDVNGVDLEGAAYSGTVEITRTTGNDYTVVWHFGDETEEGTGTFDGTTFEAHWQNGDFSGMLTYTYQPDGSLVGTWTQVGAFGQGSETLTKR